MSCAYRQWQQWPATARTRLSNMLFMICRAPSYEWDWERLVVEYMVLDAAYRTAVELRHVKPTNAHAERIESLFEGYNLRRNPSFCKQVVSLRNDLLHEALWDHGQPGAAASLPAFFAPLHLRRLNQRLIPALPGYENDYVRSHWWSIGCFVFDKSKSGTSFPGRQCR